MQKSGRHFSGIDVSKIDGSPTQEKQMLNKLGIGVKSPLD
jgi:hypothetical protein